jgi:hypothetical protein
MMDCFELEELESIATLVDNAIHGLCRQSAEFLKETGREEPTYIEIINHYITIQHKLNNLIEKYGNGGATYSELDALLDNW